MSTVLLPPAAEARLHGNPGRAERGKGRSSGFLNSRTLAPMELRSAQWQRPWDAIPLGEIVETGRRTELRPQHRLCHLDEIAQYGARVPWVNDVFDIEGLGGSEGRGDCT